MKYLAEDSFQPTNSAPRVLEIASGTGEHVAHYAAKLPHVTWQPTEYGGHAGLQFKAQRFADIRASIVGWTEDLSNVLPPLELDASASCWPSGVEQRVGLLRRAKPCFVGIVAANVAHIAPIEVLEGLLAGASRLLLPGGHLFLYGPFAVAGEALTEGNTEFEGKLRAVDGRWGLREVEQVVALASAKGLKLVEIAEMPANNKTLVFKRA